MSKELEALEIIGKLYLINDEQVKDWDKRDFNILKSALKRLEAIDNAEPSEALKCLEKLKGMEISSMPFSDEYGTQEVDLNDIRKVGSQLNTDFREYTATIKQALLKAQEPKQYLKWEDLVFTKERQEIPVRMGETIYILVLRETDDGTKIAKLLSPKRNYMGEWGDMFHKEAKQFFNDLHLERVE